MNLQINFHQMESTPAIKEKIQKKSEKLKKFFNGKFDINWTCAVDKAGHHSQVTVGCDGFTLNAESVRDDLYKTFDDVIEKLEKQLNKKKSLARNHIHHNEGALEYEE